MSLHETTDNDCGIAQDDRDADGTDGIAVDVRANDLVHIGTDTRGHNHYHDAQRDRILVVDAEHEEYDRGIFRRRSLVVDAADVVHVQTDGAVDDTRRYLQFVADHVDGRDWDEVHVMLIDEALGAALGGGIQ